MNKKKKSLLSSQKVVSEIIQADQDEAPIEIFQSDAKEAYENQEKQKLIEYAKKKLRKRQLQRLFLLNNPDENTLSLNLLKEAVALKKKQDNNKRLILSNKKKEQKQKKIKLTNVIDTSLDHDNFKLPIRDDNIQLAVTKLVNQKEIMVYQKKKVNYEQNDQYKVNSIKPNVDSFIKNYFQGERHHRVVMRKFRK